MSQRNRRAPAFEPVEPRFLLTLNFIFDYTYDAAGFFTANPQAKLVLQEAAALLGNQIQNNLAAITPDPTAGNTWSLFFTSPGDGSSVTVNNPVIPANTVLIYAGGSTDPNAPIGVGGPAGYLDNGTSDWQNLVTNRGEPNGPGIDAGAVSFAAQPVAGDSTYSWSFAGTSGMPTSHQFDFLSVAEHELAHALGFGLSSNWTSLINQTNNTFLGPRADALYGGPVPLDPATGDGHWAGGVTFQGVQPLMDDAEPLMNGTRRSMTPLDWAGMQDIGWITDQLVISGQPPDNAGVGAPFGLTVAVVGGTGGLDTTYTGAITVSLAANPTGATLGGTLTANVVGGVATFNNLTIDTPGVGYVVQAAAAGLASTGTDVFDVGHSTSTVDFTGNGRSDLGVFRVATAQWLVQLPGGGALTPTFGASNMTDIPVPGDYLGNGQTQLAVFRPSTAQWFIQGMGVFSFGATNLFDIPVPGDYLGNGKTQLAVFRPSTAQWLIQGIGAVQFGAPNLADIPVPGNYSGVGPTQLAVFRPSTGQWLINNEGAISFGGLNLTDVPLEAPIGALLALGKIPTAGGTRALNVFGAHAAPTPSTLISTRSAVAFAPVAVSATPTTAVTSAPAVAAKSTPAAVRCAPTRHATALDPRIALYRKPAPTRAPRAADRWASRPPVRLLDY